VNAADIGWNQNNLAIAPPPPGVNAGPNTAFGGKPDESGSVRHQ
jgi:hypothetical protein